MKLKIEKLDSIPIVVVCESRPCTWQLIESPHGVVRVGDTTDPQRCFVARPIKATFVEWNGMMFPKGPPAPVGHDATILREHFMGLRTEQQFLDFLNRVGGFSPLSDKERNYGWRLKDLINCQVMLGELAKRSPETWGRYADGLQTRTSGMWEILRALRAGSRYSVEFYFNGAPKKDWQGAKSIALIKTTDVLSAILAGIQIDHLRGAKFGGCARHDCCMFFEYTSNHKRMYCTQYCAHLESLRRMRKRQKREQLKSSKKKAKR